MAKAKTNKPLTKSQTQKIIEDNQKTQAQEVAEIVRYPGLKLISRFAKIFAIVVAIVFVAVAIVMLFVADGWEKLFYFFAAICLGIIYAVLSFFIGDFIQLWVDIEEHTRKMKK